MESLSESEPETINVSPSLGIAAATGLAGLTADVTWGGTAFAAAPYVCASAIGMRLPRTQFLCLTGLLAVAICLSALLIGGPGSLLPRIVALLCLILIAAVALRSPNDSTTQALIQDAPPVAPLVRVGQTSEDDPSTLIRRDLPGRLPFTDPTRDAAAKSDNCITGAIARLASVGEFSEQQIRLVESELRVLARRDPVSKSIALIGSGDHVGRFTIDRALGRGGVGNVYLGHDDKTGESAAIKVLHNARVSDRFHREMDLVQQLAHPNIVTAYEVGEVRGLPFITMELLRGPDLSVHVHENGPIDWLTSARYVLQVTRAVEHAHRRELIHRDIKPANILLNGKDLVKLVDLGLAAMRAPPISESREPELETQEGHLAGTLPYMSPEQARSLAAANVQSDIYSIGATWFFLLTGKARLPGKTFTQQFENLLVNRRFHELPDDALPESLWPVYRRMVAYDPEKRYADCATVATDLEQVLATAGAPVAHRDVHILVVEDSHTDMLLTIEMLRRTNQSLALHQASSLKEGLDTCSQMPIDLVLLDLTLPDSSGVDTVTAFRESAPQVPIVVLTGTADPEVPAACLSAGANHFVSKSGLSARRMEQMIFVTLSRLGITRSA